MKTYTSKEIYFPEIGKVSTREVSVSNEDLGEYESIIKSEASIISAGTEIARLNGLEDDTGFPCVPGYGTIGRIVEKGDKVTEFNVGDRVFFAGKHKSIQRFNHKEDHQWAYLFPVPNDISPIDATVGCMAQIAMTAPNLSNVKLNDTVAIFGLGVVGALAAVLYQLKGAKVIGLDPVKERCEMAKEMGVKIVENVDPSKQIETIMKYTNGQGADFTVDAVGNPFVCLNAIKCTKQFGKMLILGSPRKGFDGNITEGFKLIHMNCITVIGAHMWQYPVAPQRGVDFNVEWAFSTIFDLIKQDKIKARKLISHVIKPEQAAQTYKGLQEQPNEYTCAVIDWS